MSAMIADFREMLREQIEYRELLRQMTMRDLLIRYKQSIMGVGWAVLMPVVNTIVFSIIFSRVAEVRTPVPYPIFAFCGLWVWNFFSSALRFGVSSLTSNSTLVSKVYFPREIFPFSAVLVSLVDFAVGGTLLIAFMVWYQVPIGWNILWLPIVVVTSALFTAAIALALAMANLFYRDVKYLFEVVISIWMFASSVIYPVDQVQGALGILIRFNPMTPIIDAYRDVILLDLPPDASFAIVSALTVVLMTGCWLFFHRSEFRFAENI